VKYFTWDDAKNEKLKADRGIGQGCAWTWVDIGGGARCRNHRMATRKLAAVI
jgi:hypothetical protein